MILVGNHAPFTWGKTARKPFITALYWRLLPDGLADEQINPNAARLKDAYKKTFERKHGQVLLWSIKKKSR